MAFTFKITHQDICGTEKVVEGTFENTGGSTGGDIVLPLRIVRHVDLQYTGTAVVADVPVINEAMPCNNAVTIVTVANSSGTFRAYGN